jgi:NADPH-dependent glutamate synthase beta subunit-like oxidoreductase/ferredoxin
LGVSITVPDLHYWKDQIKCQAACPVHTDARGYVRAIADGDDELAYLIARGPNPLASICGRVCGAPCESACRRGDYDKPVSIRGLKRYICERFGPESREDGGKSLVEFLKDAAKRHASLQCRDKEELLPLLQSLMDDSVPRVEGKSVGIIGSGPAGLACAHDLALLGFDVTIYEMEEVLAGMLALGIPEYRLPRDLIRAEVEVITSLGVHAETGCEVGADVTLPQLRERHDAVVIAVGAKRSRMIPVPGADAPQVLGGVEFLRGVSLGHPPNLGRRVVVIGGGNVAYDVGRTVLRQIGLDAARTAKRFSGVAEVHLCSLESLEEMPADDVEIIEGDEEGIQRANSVGPKEIVRDENGDVTAVRFARCTRVFDEERRFSPEFDEEDLTEIPCDTVLIAVGQGFDISFVDADRDGVQLLGNGAIECDSNTGSTSASGVYVAGDLAYGPKLLIHAVASGKSVARAIYGQVMGKSISNEAVELHFPVPQYEREEGFEKTGRVPLRAQPATERILSQSSIVEDGYSEEEARCEAARCLNCGVNTIFDGQKCVLCGGCVDVCPETCLNIVPVSALKSESSLEGILNAQLRDVPHDEASAIIKDETVCIRCALCAERCPTGAITMESFHFEERPLCLAD